MTRSVHAGAMWILAGAAVCAPAVLADPGVTKPGGSACVTCHSELDEELLLPVEGWSEDVHQDAGLGCESCHGGDPSPGVADDMDASMSAAAGFRPAPGRLEVPEFCGTCHADAEYMKRFDPQARVDQLTEYLSSGHGRANAAGDPTPATCVDCHGVHGIRRVDDSDSPVYAPNVPAMCASCHADPVVVDSYGLSIEIYPNYMASAHAAALIERADTAAPACNDCHGNHGAAPPGVRSVANVCGQCHGREAALFRASFKKELFDSLEVAECTVCHGNHRILHPTPEMFRSASAPEISGGVIARVDPFEAALGDVPPGETAWAEWSMVLAPHLDADDERLLHGLTVEWDGGTLELDASARPGQSPPSATTSDRTGGEPIVRLSVEALSGLPVEPGDAVRLRVEIEAAGDRPVSGVRVSSRPGRGIHVVEGSVCLTCHAPGDECDQATETMYATLIDAQRNLREADRQLLEVERAGMDVGEIQFEVGSAGKTAVVEGSALIHSFEPQRLLERAEDGNAVAQVALAAAADARAELQYRRRGLGISLILILLVLVGLYLKIRQIDRARGAGQVNAKSTMTVK